MQIQISWLLQKSTDLDLHCLQRQGYLGSAGQGLITPFVDTTILSMKEVSLLVNGTLLYSVLLNTSLNWPICSSALSGSNSATPFPPLFLRGMKAKATKGQCFGQFVNKWQYLIMWIFDKGCKKICKITLNHYNMQKLSMFPIILLFYPN